MILFKSLIKVQFKEDAEQMRCQ